MTDSLMAIQHAAQQQLSALQQSAISSTALQQLQRQCYATSPYQPYNQQAELHNSLATMPAQLGCSKTELARLLILSLLTEFSLQQLPLTISSEISDNYPRSLLRIFKLWCSTDAASLPETDDKFLKDVGLLTGALLPCTERVVEPFSAIQRSLLYGNGITQAASFIRALIAAQGNKPVCRLHIHLSEINQLTAAGWRQTCQQVAQLLLLNRQLKGMVGACWFYDPAIATVSPKLAFINELLSEMQASWFYSHGEGINSGAFSRSASRKQAFENGQYQPKNYVIFIPRNRLLAWYKRQPN
ncbi:MAG: hypothetical protein CML20_08450 [Rheinheimera sp.]|uniref:hypothetical protein n=1 Tax=Arsukibacterium sp. UBA3155 TaxID=1946058 RepID=UPI000C989D99|nr:hypothetical protein [Arsukibacterium sp. UBA3155]MAD74801.1 hypothetical protein [Rheinheimera sp.]|tara:strand:+ start:27839 stop:28738 length:900 start_codon:yes stop_codon:yes gene_type:complete